MATVSGQAPMLVVKVFVEREASVVGVDSCELLVPDKVTVPSGSQDPAPGSHCMLPRGQHSDPKEPPE